MKVLIVEPGKYPREADIERTVEAFESIIGGETVGYDNGKGACFFKCKPDNEEKFPINRVLSENDVIRGAFIISGTTRKAIKSTATSTTKAPTSRARLNPNWQRERTRTPSARATKALWLATPATKRPNICPCPW